MGLTVHTVADVTVVSFERPVLSRSVLTDLDGLLTELERRTPRPPLVLHSLHETIFLAGADLADIATLDVQSSRAYGERGRAVLGRVARFPSPTVAAVNGSCSGGGFDLVLSCDRIVIGPLATFGHPGVRRGLVTGWGGTVALPAAAGGTRSRLALIAGTSVAGTALPGRVVAAAPGQDALDEAVAVAGRLAAMHPIRLRQWRALRDRPQLGWLARHRL